MKNCFLQYYQNTKRFVSTALWRRLKNSRNNKGPKIEPWGTPHVIVSISVCLLQTAFVLIRHFFLIKRFMTIYSLNNFRSILFRWFCFSCNLPDYSPNFLYIVVIFLKTACITIFFFNFLFKLSKRDLPCKYFHFVYFYFLFFYFINLGSTLTIKSSVIQKLFFWLR